jgi:hypothetical protein
MSFSFAGTKIWSINDGYSYKYGIELLERSRIDGSFDSLQIKMLRAAKFEAISKTVAGFLIFVILSFQ